MRSVTFSGKVSGDGECFLWAAVPEDDMRAVMSNYDAVLQSEKELLLEDEWYMKISGLTVEQVNSLKRSVLYPNDIMEALKVDDNKTYKFTIIAEEV